MTTNTPLSVIILAAGQGTRMQSTRPKVLQTLAGLPLIKHILRTTTALGAKTFVVYGFAGDALQNALTHHAITWVHQKEQLGTAHAVLQALPKLDANGKTLILYGDVPLICKHTLQKLIDANQHGLSILTKVVQNPFGFGRIVRQNGFVQKVVEQKDANACEQQINEINSGIYCIDNALLHQFLPTIDNNNAQKEYYLTDIVEKIAQTGRAINTISPTYDFEVDGVNDRVQLATLERTYQAHLALQHQQNGVQFADPSRVDIRGTVRFGCDVFVDINTVFIGDCTIEDGVQIDAGAVLNNCHIGQNSHILPYCVITGAVVAKNTKIGPFAHLRQDTTVCDNAKIGNFVELKKSCVKKGSKINHLSYIGDAIIGQNVNIGAGTITCNYDGVHKHQTYINDNAFIGSNASLVAPINIGQGATVAAGSVITQDVDHDKLAIGRARQITKHWTHPKKDPS